MWAESWVEIASRALSWMAIMLMAWKDNTGCVILSGSLQCAIFIRAHVPTWIKDWSLFNNLLSLKKMFWSASHSPAALALKHPPVRFVRTHWTVSRRSCHPRKRVLSAMMIHSKGPHLINPKLGHVDTQEGWLPYSEWSDLSHASQSTPTDPHRFYRSREQVFNLQCSRQGDFTPTWCVRAGRKNLFMY